MPTARCKCGEDLHYSADKVGLIARCRCGRPVRLPEPPPERAPKTVKEVFDEERRTVNRQRQILGVLAVAVVVIFAVFIFSRVSSAPSARRQERVAPEEEVEP